LDKKDEKRKKESSLKFYAKYSSLGLQMIVIILAGTFGGKALDDWLQWGFPVFTLVLTLAAVAFSIYYGIREFLK